MSHPPAELPRDGEATTATQYRKKPVVIEAQQWDGTPECADRLTEWSSGWARPFVAVWKPEPKLGMRVQTLEGEHTASVGDWLIRGIKGEYYFCKPDIFEATYEPARLSPPREGAGTTTERTARDAAAIQAYVSAQEESQRGLDMSRPPASVSTREPKPHHIERIERGTGLRWHAADRLWIWQDVGYASLEEALADRYSARLSPPRDGEVTTQREEWEVQRYREGGWFRVALAPSIASEAEGLAERDYLRREYGRLDDFRLVRRRIEETIVESTPSTPDPESR